MQLTKGSSHYTTMSAIKLHRWPLSKTTGINTETQELIFKYYKLPSQLSKLHINHLDNLHDNLHSALNTCINKFVS